MNTLAPSLLASNSASIFYQITGRAGILEFQVHANTLSLKDAAGITPDSLLLPAETAAEIVNGLALAREKFRSGATCLAAGRSDSYAQGRGGGSESN